MIKLAVFDIDDTLTIGPSIWEQMYHEIGKWESHGRVYLESYLQSGITWEEFARLDVWEYRGHHVNVIIQAAEKLQFIDGIEETFSTLKSRGVATAFVSSTLYPFANWLSHKYGIDHCHANPIGVDEAGRITGKIELKVVAPDKHLVMQELKQKLGVKKEEVLSVGDSHLDFSMFDESGLCFCPPHASAKVKKRVDQVLPCNDLRYILQQPEFGVGVKRELNAIRRIVV